MGIRKLSGETKRSWLRIQVSDLTLTTVEEVDTVKFIVTSLSTGKPVSNAKVKIEGIVYQGSSSYSNSWDTIIMDWKN